MNFTNVVIGILVVLMLFMLIREQSLSQETKIIHCVTIGLLAYVVFTALSQKESFADEAEDEAEDEEENSEEESEEAE